MPSIPVLNCELAKDDGLPPMQSASAVSSPAPTSSGLGFLQNLRRRENRTKLIQLLLRRSCLRPKHKHRFRPATLRSHIHIPYLYCRHKRLKPRKALAPPSSTAATNCQSRPKTARPSCARFKLWVTERLSRSAEGGYAGDETR
uniref:Uncharacterized protein n=1 Tax=Mycena chlorophos TaxID=658473 RepID=A0ABQ0LKK5_MYCCL|nr:predicted protein [Mycena chlorophos]